MSNPYKITGPTCISMSGGRTSAFMLRKTLDDCENSLPPDAYVIFANTGKERPETLDFVHQCSVQWGVPIVWVEYVSKLEGGLYREVTYETASRNGEPFSKLIEEKKYLPNIALRFCTEFLKVRAIQWAMRQRGHEDYDNLVGLRADEARRVATVRAKQEPDRCPLYDAGVTEQDVLAFWKAQPFDLQLARGWSNCDLCFLKGYPTLLRLEQERPGSAAWWADKERAIGATFGRDNVSYRHLQTFASKQTTLPIFESSSPSESLSCACTD